MRLKTFSAATMQEAMAQVRAALGDDAVIVSTYRSSRGRGVEITAAVEPDPAERQPATPAATATAETPGATTPPASRAEAAALLARALAWHGLPAKLNERLCMAAMAIGAPDPLLALAGALDAACEFAALPEAGRRPLMLVGPAGAGKTVTAAKLAARAVIAGRRVRLVTTDTVRAGGIDQLTAYGDVLGQPVVAAETAETLAQAVAALAPDELAIVDSPGTSPHNADELADLARFVDAVQAEPVLVLPAAGDAAETAEIAEAFAAVGARLLVATRLDAARRYGGLVNALAGADLAFSAAGVSPFVAQGLQPVNPVSLARLLLADPLQPQLGAAFAKAAE